jgi:predicted methyltransferase
MKRLAAALLAASFLAAPAFAETAADPIAAAVADTARPAADVERDGNRQPAVLLAFIDIKPGMNVADWVPGGGYFTRLFADVVGDAGHVYALVPAELKDKYDMGKNAEAVAAEHKNIMAVIEPMLATTSVKDLDIFWTSQNYHDLHTPGFGSVDTLTFNKQVFAMLKPGGYYVIVDHRAADGAPVDETADSLHRIDPAAVKAEVEAAGFVFDSESVALANPADDHTLNVFDEKVRGHTDQFVYKFKKPAE